MNTTTTRQDTMDEVYWTPQEKSSLKNKYGTELLVESCTELHLQDKSFPMDAYVVTYKNYEGEVKKDLVRSAKRVNIFDMYYDKFGPDSMMDIDFGPGRVNPKIWGEKPQEEKKRRR